MAELSGERRLATARYIEDMLAELRAMGKQINADVLVYFVEMAMLEANAAAKGMQMETPKYGRVVETTHKVSADDLAGLYMADDI